MYLAGERVSADSTDSKRKWPFSEPTQPVHDYVIFEKGPLHIGISKMPFFPNAKI